MDEYIEVRKLSHEGLSIRAIARKTGFHRRTIKKILSLQALPGYRRKKPPAKSILGPNSSNAPQCPPIPTPYLATSWQKRLIL